MKKAASCVLTGLLAGGGLAVLVALVAPATAAHAAVACTTPPTDLYAASGTVTLGVQPVTVWGYNTTAGAAVTKPGGPTLCVTAGTPVSLTLHNELSENTALLIQGQNMVPDRVGAPPLSAAPANTKTYTFTPDKPGTYLYEAGLVPNGQHQVAMGLYGALVVRPATAPLQAYDDASTAFNDEAVLVLSEIDPALNNRSLTLGGPATFDMRKYAPRYSLINGKVHPNTDLISTTAGNKVLLRYVNAGNLYHSMGVLGADQTIIGLDGSPLGFSRQYVAETFGPGQTTDALVTAPATNGRLSVYDASLLLHNSNTAGSGGMLTFVEATGGVGTVAGPATTNVTYAAGTLTATTAATATAVEYYLDCVTGTAPCTATGISSPGSGTFTATVAAPPGQHILYVRAQDAALNWGAFSSVLVTGGDIVGPATTSPSLSPTPTNGSADVAVHATGDDTATGGSNIIAAEYFIGADPGAGNGTAMTVNLAAPVASLDATIPAAAVAALTPDGAHVVSVRSQDGALNWSLLPATINLVVDTAAPSTSAVSASPNPNNGTLGLNSSTAAVRVTATLSDLAGTVSGTISGAEAFLCTTPAVNCAVGANGTGIVMTASDGVFNQTAEFGYTDIPLATVAQLTAGDHTIYVHAKDNAGNWGPTTPMTLVIDKTRPTGTAVSASPNPTLGATSVTLSVTAAADASGINRGEWFIGADPGVGNGTQMTTPNGSGTGVSALINVSSWNDAAYTINARARDAAGNWSVTSSTLLQVRGPLSFSTFGNSSVGGLGNADDADIYQWSGTTYTRAINANGAPASPVSLGLPANANVDGFDQVDATHFYMSFSADNTSVPGIGNVQDEDVVYYNGATWSVYFDGTARSLTAANQDLDAISVVGPTDLATGTGGTLLFSTLGNTAVLGLAAPDDADIYSWVYGTTGLTPFTRAIDANGAGSLGLPAGANVDGFVRVDATHFYLSFSATTTTVPVLGNVDDEDVIYYNNGVWSIYFDGSTHGLGGNDNLDVDAFDVP